MSTCLKTFSLEVTSAVVLPLEWWKLDEANNDPRVGSVNGIVLNPFGLSSAPGVIGNATQITGLGNPTFDSGSANFFVSNPALYYDGNGLTMLMWMKLTAGMAINGNQVSFPTLGGLVLKFTFNTVNLVVTVNNAASSIIGTITVPYVPSGSFEFIEVYYDPNASIVGLKINDGALVDTTSAVTGGVFPSISGGIAQIAATCINPGVQTGQFCEWAIYPFVLSNAQTAYIYNGGAGRTWPVTLP